MFRALLDTLRKKTFSVVVERAFTISLDGLQVKVFVEAV